MIKLKLLNKILFSTATQFSLILFALSFLSSAGRAEETSTHLGFPDSAKEAIQSVMGFPASTQWKQELIHSFLYLSYNSGQMAAPTLTVADYVSDYGSTQYAYPSLDYFTHFISFAEPESKSVARDFSLWGRYSLGFADRDGGITSAGDGINTSIEKVSLLMMNVRIGVLLSYDHFVWFKPFFGLELDPNLYRQTSDLSGAEQQGAALSWGPSLGAHFPILFDHRVSFEAEIRRMIAMSSSGQLFNNSNTLTAGLGVTF